MFGNTSLAEIEAYLYENIQEAKRASEEAVLFTLLNEMIGFCRDTTQKEKALAYCDELLKLLKKMQLEGSVEYATALLNIANAYRAFALLQESSELFAKVEGIYKEHLPANDFGYANLYNNWALTYQESENYEEAIRVLKLALQIVDSYVDAVVPQATTRTNLAATLIQMGSEECYAEAIGYLQEALKIHEDLGRTDFHYGATLVALGDAYCFQKEFHKAAKAYAEGMKEIEKHTGRNENYERVRQKYLYALKRNSNLNRCERFYEQFGKIMIHEKFPAYENRIAVGMVGEVSDCFVFEDDISTDHDYGI
jgi:tetratricopeptide (TPR) repeat protein